jgi:hypothetical protein
LGWLGVETGAAQISFSKIKAVNPQTPANVLLSILMSTFPAKRLVEL